MRQLSSRPLIGNKNSYIDVKRPLELEATVHNIPAQNEAVWVQWVLFMSLSLSISINLYMCSTLLFFSQRLKSHLHEGFKIKVAYKVQWYLSRSWKSTCTGGTSKMNLWQWNFRHQTLGRWIEREILQALEIIPG